MPEAPVDEQTFQALCFSSAEVAAEGPPEVESNALKDESQACVSESESSRFLVADTDVLHRSVQ